MRISAEVEREQRVVLETLRSARDGAATDAALKRLSEAARTDENLIPLIIDAVRAEATEGEIIGAMKSVWGEYREAPRF
jgi:methylmalonyl-CoA mutase N-terminal domain/subunit